VIRAENAHEAAAARATMHGQSLKVSVRMRRSSGSLRSFTSAAESYTRR
jgi:hypothetical protein